MTGLLRVFAPRAQADQVSTLRDRCSDSGRVVQLETRTTCGAGGGAGAEAGVCWVVGVSFGGGRGWQWGAGVVRSSGSSSNRCVPHRSEHLAVQGRGVMWQQGLDEELRSCGTVGAMGTCIQRLLESV
jgi:hypothetical protein